VRDPLRAILKSSGIDDGDGVDRLVTDVREEIEVHEAILLRQKGAYDEDELNTEFRLLELECDLERRRPKEEELPPIEREKPQLDGNEEEVPSMTKTMKQVKAERDHK
jgi:hypothetical protein